MPEYMRVRQYLYNLISNCDGESMQIPPENELCRIFGVSRVTVRGAIRELIRENLLVTRRGLGTFIHPDAVPKQHIRLPVIGILSGDGRQTYQSSDPTVMQAIRRCAMLSESLYLPDSKAPERLLEIIRNNIAGVIWTEPSPKLIPYLQAIRNSGKPLLLISNRFDRDFDSVRDAPAERGVLLANHLVSLGHRHVLYLHNYPAGGGFDRPEQPETTSGSLMRHLHELTGNGSVGFLSLLEFEQHLAEHGIGKYTVLYSDANLVRPVMKLLNDAEIRVPEDISYLTAWQPSPRFFHGETPAWLDCDSDKIECIVEWLQRKIIDGEQAPFLATASTTLHNGNTLRPNKKKGNA